MCAAQPPLPRICDAACPSSGCNQGPKLVIHRLGAWLWGPIRRVPELLPSLASFVLFPPAHVPSVSGSHTPHVLCAAAADAADPGAVVAALQAQLRSPKAAAFFNSEAQQVGQEVSVRQGCMADRSRSVQVWVQIWKMQSVPAWFTDLRRLAAMLLVVQAGFGQPGTRVHRVHHFALYLMLGAACWTGSRRHGACARPAAPLHPGGGCPVAR